MQCSSKQLLQQCVAQSWDSPPPPEHQRAQYNIQSCTAIGQHLPDRTLVRADVLRV